jgi:hypothetical protein
MSVQLADSTKHYECCVCWSIEFDEWGQLAKVGWRSHYAGHGVEPITICGSCDEHMTDRRAAAQV